MPFYAVAKGKKTGIFSTWSECQEQILGFKGPVYKKFNTEEEADKFIQERGSNIIDKRTTSKNNEKKSTNNSSADSSGSSVKRRASDSDDDEDSKPKKAKLTEVEREKGKFLVDSDGYLVVYTDGSCGFHGKHGVKAGVGVFFGEDHPMNLSEPVKGRATNNTAEIQAATYALELSKSAGFDKVILNTDSQYMINCATSWMPNWKKNDWKKKDGSEVVNRDDLIELDKASENLLVKWNFVKKEEGNPGNEAADKLAREGAKKYKKED